jgi:hypothetical protein
MQTRTASVLTAPSTSSVCRANNPFRNVTELHAHGGSFTSIGGDVHNNVQLNYNVEIHHHFNPNDDSSDSAPEVDVLAILNAVSNQRKIQQDTLSKATPKTGGWMLRHEKLAVWQDPKSGLDMMCGSGMRESLSLMSA